MGLRRRASERPDHCRLEIPLVILLPAVSIDAGGGSPSDAVLASRSSRGHSPSGAVGSRSGRAPHPPSAGIAAAPVRTAPVTGFLHLAGCSGLAEIGFRRSDQSDPAPDRV